MVRICDKFRQSEGAHMSAAPMGRSRWMMNMMGCVLILGFCTSLAAHAAEWTGLQIMEERARRHEAATERIEMTMLLEAHDGITERRLLHMYEKGMPDGLRRSLAVFEAPPNIQGTALLTWEQTGRDDDQWLYLPSRGKLQRVAGGGKTGYFMGSDFTFEDLETESLENHEYRRLESSVIDSNMCFVVEARPKDESRRRSGYARRVLWIREDVFLPIKIEYYDHRDRLIKTWHGHDAFPVQGEAWHVRHGVMSNVARRHKTVTETESIELNIEIDDITFTDRYLLSERHLR